MAHEQGHVEMRFERLDLLADRGRRDMQLFGRALEAQVARSGLENA